MSIEKLNKTSIVLGDLFQSEANTFIIPRSTTGTLSDSFIAGLQDDLNYNLNSDLPYRPLGSLDIIRNSNIKTESGTFFSKDILFATSVDNNMSNLNAITKIIADIARYTQTESGKIIACPLLGTGAGKLDPIKVYEVLSRVFNQNADESSILYIYINDEKIFNHVFEYISIAAPNSQGIQASGKQGRQQRRSYWVLKLNPRTWLVDQLHRGTLASYHATYVSEKEDKKRDDYDLFTKVNKGDLILGYATEDENSFVCVFEVTSPILNDGYGDHISLIVSQPINPKIPFKLISDNLNINNDFFREARRKLIEISENDYYAVSGHTSEKNQEKSQQKVNPGIQSRLHSDNFNPEESDVLNYDLIAENLFSILTTKNTRPPMNIGIIAPWGRGKTTLMKRLEMKMKDKREEIIKVSHSNGKSNNASITRPTLRNLLGWVRTNDILVNQNLPFATVWFNPWNYQSADMIWAGLANNVIEQVVAQIPNKIEQEIFWFKLRLSRLDKNELRRDLQTRLLLYGLQFIVWGLAGILGVIFFIYLIQAKPISPLFLSCFSGSILLGIISRIANYLKPWKKTISEAFDKYTKAPRYTEKTGTFHEVQEDLSKVLELCIDENHPLTIFIDDLDRCSPSKVVEVVEAINVFISGKYNGKCYFVIGMDAEIVAGALDVSYEKMKGKLVSKEAEQGSIGWYFLDKFIQLPFFLPVMSMAKKKEYLETLLKDKTVEIERNREQINEEKVKIAFDRVMSLGDIGKSVETISSFGLSALEENELDKRILQDRVESPIHNNEISTQVSVYSQFISSDPRSLKRFTNLLRFYSSYQFLRMKKGQDYAEIEILAKWLVLMLKFPQMVRWIQWDLENKTGINSAAEEKTKIIDDIILAFRSENEVTFDNWLDFEISDRILNEKILATNDSLKKSKVKIGDLNELIWLKSQNMFNVLMHNNSEGDKFANALRCNVW